MSENIALGKLVCGNPGRDAVHIGTIAVRANEDLQPAEHIGFVDKEKLLVAKANWTDIKRIGIVDPFLTRRVYKNQKFLLVLYPGTINGLRHEWTHPALDKQTKISKKEAEEWLRDFVENSDCPSYDTVIAAATGQHVPIVEPIYGEEAYTNDGEYLYFKGRDAHSEIPPIFWKYVQIVTGVQIPKSKRAKFFTCSC
ncbi:MAG: hypothetical protein DWQ19_12905 [Crenarchaeota archaeon]|nr:MAG: hypothetical protein DWQ19_12905 [Thermoproteota archaeon]